MLQDEGLLTDDEEEDMYPTHAYEQPTRRNTTTAVPHADAHMDADSYDDSADGAAGAHVPLAVLASPAHASKAECAHPTLPADTAAARAHRSKPDANASALSSDAAEQQQLGGRDSGNESGSGEDDESAIAAMKKNGLAAGSKRAGQGGQGGGGGGRGGDLEVVPQVCLWLFSILLV